MEQKTILLSAPYMIPFLDRFIPVLEELGFKVIVPEVNERLSVEEILHYAGKFDGAICGDDRYTAEVIEACAPRLKVISKWGTGIDSIDKKAAEAHGISVHRTTNAFTVPVSDSVMAYILAFARKQPWMNCNIKNGVWEKIPGHSLQESTLGVIGVGYIGKAVLRKAQAFGMTLLANDIAPIPETFIQEVGVEVVSLETLAARADYISVNCDLNPTSQHLLNAEVIAKMKPNAVVINTARGPIIDQPALIDALKRGQIAGAALDVFEDEPIPADSALLRMDQVMLAPHNSNSSPRAWEAVHWNTIKNMIEGFGLPVDHFEKIKSEKMERY
jgi:D-3-phosphoglycerate dehydrogenase / 2-oxoglutarate reductase